MNLLPLCGNNRHKNLCVDQESSWRTALTRDETLILSDMFINIYRPLQTALWSSVLLAVSPFACFLTLQHLLMMHVCFHIGEDAFLVCLLA